MTNLLKRIKANALFSAILYILLGLVLLLWPERSTSALCLLLGAVLFTQSALAYTYFETPEFADVEYNTAGRSSRTL